MNMHDFSGEVCRRYHAVYRSKRMNSGDSELVLAVYGAAGVLETFEARGGLRLVVDGVEVFGVQALKDDGSRSELSLGGGDDVIRFDESLLIHIHNDDEKGGRHHSDFRGFVRIFK